MRFIKAGISLMAAGALLGWMAGLQHESLSVFTPVLVALGGILFIMGLKEGR